MKVPDWLRLPQARGIEDLDDPAVTVLHAKIIQSKPFLKKTYEDFYRQFHRAVPDPERKTLVELGSGGGFIKEVIGNVITSDILDLPHVDKVFSAAKMPFEQNSVDALWRMLENRPKNGVRKLRMRLILASYSKTSSVSRLKVLNGKVVDGISNLLPRFAGVERGILSMVFQEAQPTASFLVTTPTTLPLS